MRIRYLLAAIAAGVTASNGFAQTTGTTTGGTTTGGGGNTGLQTTSANNFQIQQMTQAPQIASAATTGSSLNSTNAFSQYYANPLYQGRAGAAITETPGGFGTAMGGTGTAGGGGGRAVGATGLNQSRTGTGATGTATGGRTGTAATTAGGTGTGATGGLGGLGGGATGGRAGGTTAFGAQGGRAGATGGLGGANARQQGNAIVQLPRQITYTMTMKMPMPKSTPVQIATQMQSDLRSVIDRSSSIANPRGIEVSTDGAVVVLRGRVKDEEEAATAEGIIRLTPGVKGVKNELKY